jgi:predicted GTPase
MQSSVAALPDMPTFASQLQRNKWGLTPIMLAGVVKHVPRQKTSRVNVKISTGLRMEDAAKGEGSKIRTPFYRRH